jgi:hypothetical protein
MKTLTEDQCSTIGEVFNMILCADVFRDMPLEQLLKPIEPIEPQRHNVDVFARSALKQQMRERELFRRAAEILRAMPDNEDAQKACMCVVRRKNASEAVRDALLEYEKSQPVMHNPPPVRASVVKPVVTEEDEEAGFEFDRLRKTNAPAGDAPKVVEQAPKVWLSLKACGDCWLHVSAPSGRSTSINIGPRKHVNNEPFIDSVIHEVASLRTEA